MKLLVMLLAAWRRARIVDWLLFAGFGALSLMAVRNAIFVAWIAPVILAAYLPKPRWLPPAAAAVASEHISVFLQAGAWAAKYSTGICMYFN